MKSQNAPELLKITHMEKNFIISQFKTTGMRFKHYTPVHLPIILTVTSSDSYTGSI